MKFFFLVIVGIISALTYGFSQCNTSLNLALGRPSTASSVENAGLPASNAFDGNLLTRWGSAFTDAEYIYVDLGSNYPLCEVYLDWEAAYGKDFTIDISTDAVTWTTAATITGNTSLTNTIAISGTGRYVRMNGIARATGYGYSIHEFQVYSSDPTPLCPGINIALGKPAVASSLENAGYPASNAFDGNLGTRWSSGFTDPQYIYVDLGSVYNLCSISLNWETAYGKDFTIDASNDAISWITLSTVTGNTLLNNTIPVSGSGRYVRMYGTARATIYGYSLYEFSVTGSVVLPVTLIDFKAFQGSNHEVLLKWTTEQEVNNQAFEIQRGSDSSGFLTVGTVQGAGNSSIPVNYSFTDKSPLPGVNYYRLKQIDFDQHIQYSYIVSMNMGQDASDAIIAYPNPVIDRLTLKSGNRSLKSISIYSLTGSKQEDFFPAGTNTQVISLSNFPTGIYMVRVLTDQRTEYFKVMKK